MLLLFSSIANVHSKRTCQIFIIHIELFVCFSLWTCPHCFYLLVYQEATQSVVTVKTVISATKYSPRHQDIKYIWTFTLESRNINVNTVEKDSVVLQDSKNICTFTPIPIIFTVICAQRVSLHLTRWRIIRSSNIKEHHYSHKQHIILLPLIRCEIMCRTIVAFESFIRRSGLVFCSILLRFSLFILVTP